jgi:hypothetical protein
MTLEKKVSAAFRMDEETWMRHANPWSVWSRNTVLPLLVLGFWSRIWWGWGSVLLVFPALAWMVINPRIFPKPISTDNWASRGVLGERVWLNRDEIPVPVHHRRMPHIVSTISVMGMLFLIWGIYLLEVWPLVAGLLLIYLGKLWFLDRMVWLYQDMQNVPTYKLWLY